MSTKLICITLCMISGTFTQVKSNSQESRSTIVNHFLSFDIGLWHDTITDNFSVYTFPVCIRYVTNIVNKKTSSDCIGIGWRMLIPIDARSDNWEEVDAEGAGFNVFVEAERRFYFSYYDNNYSNFFVGVGGQTSPATRVKYIQRQIEFPIYLHNQQS